MREFKFRAWNKRIQEMVDLEEITYLALNADIPGIFIRYHEDLVIMQYTGLKDKNGKEIYEGDCVRFGEIQEITTLPQYGESETFKVYRYYCLGKVEYVNGGFIINNQRKEKTWSFYSLYSKEETEKKIIFEIIGNIYENQELLEAGWETVNG